MTDFYDKVYDETFDSVYAQMTLKKNTDPEFTKSQLDELIRHMYCNQGNDWEGRGEIKDIILSATIAACEVFLHNWDK